MKTIPEIILGLESHVCLDRCGQCPYNEPRRGHCVEQLMKDALQVIRSMDDDRK